MWSAVGGNGGPNCHRIGGIVSYFIGVDGDKKGFGEGMVIFSWRRG